MKLNYDERFLIAGIATVFIVFTLVRTKLPHYTLPAFPLLCLLLSLAWGRADGLIPTAPKLATGMAVFGLVVSLIGFTLAKPLFTSAVLARLCGPQLRPEMEIAAAGFHEPSLCWNFRRTLDSFVQYTNSQSLPSFMTQAGPRMCILPTSELETVFASVPDEWPRVRTKGINLANGKRLDLTALVKPQ